MNRNKYILKIFCATLLAVIAGACTDDTLEPGSGGGVTPPWEDADMVCLPIGLSFDVSGVSTRATGDLVNGSDNEHVVDTAANENFVIFFDQNNKIKYIKQLYLSSQINEALPETTEGSERTLYAVTYVPRTDVVDEENTDNSLLKNILVVLNGGVIYQNLENKVNSLLTTHAFNDIDSIMAQTWTCSQNDMSHKIGRNSNGNFTMSNSTYIVNNSVRCAAPLNSGMFYVSINDFIDAVKADPANVDSKVSATVYLERMVAKFSAPSFNTDVFGSDRVFRPDQNAMSLIVYHWEGDSLKSEQRNWRIHLLGWTINGEETKNYIFKNVKSTGYWSGWNDNTHFRSNWSEDPHYDSADDDFYPWQYRKAADRSDIISVEGSYNSAETKNPALRYYSFRDVSWPDSIYVHENTYNPSGNWYEETSPYYLDDRASLLAGSHLLLTGELYLEGGDGTNEGGSTYNEFGTVSDIYSDRIRRYFLTEADWFKMFVRDFNYALLNQEEMHFPVYDWDNNSSGKANHSYTAKPAGECKLYYDGIPLTFERIDSIATTGTSLSATAYVRNGDGRLIPWISSQNSKGEHITLRVRNEKAQELEYDTDNVNDTPGWTDDMYMSLFYDWFGPIDHFKNGYMYYAGEIKHHNAVDNNDANYFGVVRNHWYKFSVESINALGIPVDDPDQLIIPGKYAYRDQVLVYLRILDYHRQYSDVDLSN